MVQTKFQKDAEFFLSWCVEQGVGEVDLYPNLLANFKEPTRHKMNAFIRYALEVGFLHFLDGVNFDEGIDDMSECFNYSLEHGKVYPLDVPEEKCKSWNVGTINLTKELLNKAFIKQHGWDTWYMAAGKNKYKIDNDAQNGTLHVCALQKSTPKTVEKDIHNIISYCCDLQDDTVESIASSLIKLSI